MNAASPFPSWQLSSLLFHKYTKTSWSSNWQISTDMFILYYFSINTQFLWEANIQSLFFHHLMFCLFYSAYTLPDRVFNSFHIHQRFFIQQLTLAQGKSLFAYYHLLRLKSWILYMNWLHYWKSLISTLKGRLGVFCSNAMSQGSIQHSTQMLNNGEVHIECICSSLWCKDE